MARPQPESGYDLAVPGPGPGPAPAPARPSASPPAGPRSAGGGWLALLLAWALCVLHGVALWVAMGGREGIAGDWPLLTADHGIHYHHGVVTRHFLRSAGITAGYDPSFMSGYAMSIVSDLSSTFSDLVMLGFADRPALGYKLHVLGCSAVLPWLVALAAAAWRARPLAVALAVLAFLIYFWTDFPVSYAALGMLDYLLSVPLGLVAVAALTNYLDRGGFGRWLAASTACSAVFLVHLTSPMLVGPAGLLAYAVAATRPWRGGRPFPASRHLGLWAMAPIVLAANAFWWAPGYLLASTKGASDLAFAHPEPVLRRLGEIVWDEAPIESVALGLGLVGLAWLARREAVAAAGLGGFLAAGFGWGYLAGFSRSLDAVQPGRHTYACYSAACIAAGFGLAETLARLGPPRSPRIDRWAAAGLVLAGLRVFGPSVAGSVRERVVAHPFLESRPGPRATWLVDRVRRHVKPGERLLYEETGLAVAGLGDPFGGEHYSPILPGMTGVEVIGGPYLHATVTTNFTQFGEGKLFGSADWGRDRFERYARLYRPSAIACWSPRARGFCLANPDLVRVVEDDGTLLIGRVAGFEGAAIRGAAEVEAGPNRLVVRNASAGPDGLVVLRYHAVPYMQATPPVAIEPVRLEDDPVPFLAFRPAAGPVTFEMVLPPRAKATR